MKFQAGDLVIYRQFDFDPDPPVEMGIVVEGENTITKRVKVRWLWGRMNVTNEPVEWIKLLSRVNHA